MAMLNVALTGNIASGKSEVADVWRRAGARIIDADVLARRAVEPGSDALRQIVERWGPGMLQPSGELDRATLRDIVFRDTGEREALERIVHPVVARLRAAEIARAVEAGDRIVVSDIPLLFETGMEGNFDFVVLVDAPESERIRRLVDLRGLDRNEALRMVAAQLPAAVKRMKADIIIENDQSLEALRSQAATIWRELQARAEES